jgi:hypothetical protein
MALVEVAILWFGGLATNKPTRFPFVDEGLQCAVGSSKPKVTEVQKTFVPYEWRNEIEFSRRGFMAFPSGQICELKPFDSLQTQTMSLLGRMPSQ